MNEQEFQQQYSAIIRSILPTFQEHEVTSQRSFKIKFGHHNVFVDGKEPRERAKSGIYDLLLWIDNKPVIMLELKRPGLKLTDDDRDQGVSYARLTDPITPVTVISNGSAFRIYDTFSKEPIEQQTLEKDFLLNRVDQAAKLARNDYKNSILTLIENDQRVLYDLLNTISEQTFNELTGVSTDVSKPIIENFCVPREALGSLHQAVVDNQFVVLTGDAYSGKTNFLYQYYQNQSAAKEAVLYINCIDFHYSIFRKLANHIHKLLRFPVDELKLKEWLLLHFNEETEKKLTIIFDHVRNDIDPVMMADISELLDLFRMDGNRIIISTDQSNYRLLKRNSDRVLNTIIGNNFFEVELDKFSTKEFFDANEILADKYNLSFAWGAVYSDVYRLPRIWRLLVNNAMKDWKEGHYGLIKSVPGVEFLSIFRSTFQLDYESVGNFIKLIDAFIEGIDQVKGSRLKLMACNLGIIPEPVALQHLDRKQITRLIGAGYLERRSIPGFQWVLVTKLPELLAGYAVSSLKNKYQNWLKEDFDVAYESFISFCEFLPYGELVACRFILDLGNEGELDLFSDLANRLFNDKPTLKISTSEMDFEIYVQKVGNVRVKLEEGGESKFMGNGFPYLVLSQLLCTGIVGEGDDPHSLRLELIEKLAEEAFIIRKADRTFFHEGLETMELGRVGEVVKTNIGIVEPITQALLVNMLELPGLFESFYEYAVMEKKYRLLHRMYIAAKNAKAMNMADAVSEPVCERIISEYEERTPEVMAFALRSDQDSEEELKHIEDRIREIKKTNSFYKDTKNLKR
ncbi:type I restriction enzyme HsdR N-terminal domain-containing protein [Pedobacter sp. ASV12]|uniref:type I restriction enzyme HsdR N-terminal domain-containing protein n=1 Tax=Pedobacter sp. ASV12 TaxID=2795120 RepID=UPI0018EC26B8|nr:type I restriction enzyme HsdR N-terminal domain-containing protein [Pedobacter sp. ASV12]